MAYIVTREYFLKELSIPNVNEVRDVSGGTDTFEMYIDKEARQLLKDALGYDLFKDFDSYVDVNGVISPVAPAKWLNLVNGTDYVVDGVTYRWQGLIFDEGAFKSSVLAYYVYCKWLEFQISQMTGVGEMKGDAVNSTPYNSTQRLVTLWNTFVEMYQDTECKSPVRYYYDGVLVNDYSYHSNSNYVSLIKFLQDNDTDYQDASLRLYGLRNSLGI